MKIYRLADQSALAYRICIMRSNPKDPSKLEVRPLFMPVSNRIIWTPIKVGQPLMGAVHVGTKAKYCLAYFSGNTELPAGETEVLLTLKVPSASLPQEESFMGNEAIVNNPVVVNIERVTDAENKPEYQ